MLSRLLLIEVVTFFSVGSAFALGAWYVSRRLATTLALRTRTSMESLEEMRAQLEHAQSERDHTRDELALLRKSAGIWHVDPKTARPILSVHLPIGVTLPDGQASPAANAGPDEEVVCFGEVGGPRQWALSRAGVYLRIWAGAGASTFTLEEAGRLAFFIVAALSKMDPEMIDDRHELVQKIRRLEGTLTKGEQGQFP